MNRIDRISAILIQLQSKRIVKGQEIADRFNISLRTVYRDIRTLEEAGVPILSEAGTGYSIMDGYRLPPVMFTKEEALAFITAEKLVEKLTDPGTLKIYQSALYKIKAVLRSDEKEHVETMSQFIEVMQSPGSKFDQPADNALQKILNGIAQKEIIELTYFANHSQESTNRKVEPIGIYIMANQWYLIAYCQLRKDYRTFKVDRIAKLKLLGHTFPTKHPSLKSYLDKLVLDQRDLKEVVIVADKKIMKYIGEQKYYNGFVSQRETKRGIELSFLTCSLEGFARWYLMLGDQASIIKPVALKNIVLQMIQQIQKGLN